MNRREPGRAESRVPGAAAEVAAPQRLTLGTGEHEPVVTGRGKGHDVPGKVRCDHRRNGHGPVTGLRFGRPECEAAAALLAELPGYPDCACLEVDVGPTQRGQLAPAQAAENGEQHQGAVPIGHRAGLIGRSVSWLSQVERGTRAVDRMSVLIDLSRVLKVDIAELTGQPFALAPNGGLEPEGLADIRRVLMRYTELPAAINPGPGTAAAPADLVRLRSRVDTAWRLRQASRYEQLGRQIAGLITDTEQAAQYYHGDEQQIAFALLAETYQVTRAMLRKLGDTHLAWIAADRAVRAGRQTDNPLLVAVGARALSQVFTETGQLDPAGRPPAVGASSGSGIWEPL